MLVVNKVDNFDKFMPDVYEFYNLGIGDPVPISAASRLGIGDMLDEVVSHFPEGAGETEGTSVRRSPSSESRMWENLRSSISFSEKIV